MKDLFKLILGVLASLFKSRAKLEAEILILRQQINVLRRRAPKRPHLNNTDRFLFVWVYHWFPSVLGAITIGRPETIIRWHRAGFRVYWRWRSRNRVGRPKVSAELAHAHWRDEPRERALGRATHSWGTAQARLRGRPVDGRSVYVPQQVATISGLADVSQQPYRRHRSGRPFCPADDRIRDSLLSCYYTTRTTTLGIVWRDGKPDCGVDLAPDHRGFPMGPHAAIYQPGSGHLVWASLRATSARHGYSRSTDYVPLTLAKCICREAHRLYPPGVPGPHDRIR